MRTTVHQLDENGKCWREHEYVNISDSAARALHDRIARGYKLAKTMVTVDGLHVFGAYGEH